MRHFIGILVLSMPACALADVVINDPKVDGYGLDYCREWAANCGKPAADAFCEAKGYRQAISWKVRKDNQKTRIINGGQVCDAPACDRITSVTCQEARVRIDNPMINGYGLDYCREWAANCGKPAADAFCQTKGYRESSSWKVRKDNQKTRIINGGQICDNTQCDRITSVVCDS